MGHKPAPSGSIKKRLQGVHLKVIQKLKKKNKASQKPTQKNLRKQASQIFSTKAEEKSLHKKSAQHAKKTEKETAG